MKKLRLLVGMLLAAGLTTGIAPQAATADPSVPIVPPVHGYVWGNQPTNPNYFLNTGYEYNSLGGAVQIIRISTGRYQLIFHDMGRTGGIAHVAAYGSNDRCALVNWFPSGDDQFLNVRCFDHDGAAADTRFIANFTTRKPAGVSFGYLWNDNPTPPWYGHVPPTTWSHDGAGEQIRVYREGEGRYLVYLGAFAQDTPNQWRNGLFTATVYGSTLIDCNAKGADLDYPSYISVSCADLDGQFADARFTLTYARDKSIFGTSLRASVLANVIEAEPVVEGWSNSAGGAPTVTKLGTGYFQVAFPNIGAPRGHAYVEQNTFPMFCNVYSWWSIGTTQYVWIRCFDPAIGEPHPVHRINVTFIP